MEMWYIMLFVLGKDLMKRWKTLRDAFVRELRCVKKVETGVPASKKKKYVFYDHLSFLLPHVKGNENNSTNIPPVDNLQHDDIEHQQAVDDPEVNSNLHNTNAVNPKPSTAERKLRQDRVVGKTSIAKTLMNASQNITNLMQESIALQKADSNVEKISTDKTGNKAFLMSFVPLMDSLPPPVALDVRLQITELFRNATRMQSQSSCYSHGSSQSPTQMYTWDDMQMRNRPLSSTSTRNTPTPSGSINQQEDDISQCSNNDLFKLSDFVKFSVLRENDF